MSTQPTSFQDQLAELSNDEPQQQGQNISTRVRGSKSLVTSEAGGQGIGRLFGDLTKCNIGKLTININPNFQVHCSAEDEFDEIVKDIDINIS